MPKVESRARQLRLERAARLGRAVTLEEVAGQTGLTIAALSRIENNKNERIDFDTITKLCVFYGVGVGDLLVLKPEDTRRPALAFAF